MASDIPESAPRDGEIAPGQITALRRYGARLFLNADQPFGGINGVGSVQTSPLGRARYRSPGSGRLFTILASGIEDEEAAKGSLIVVVETPAPPSTRWPNAYVEERIGTGLDTEAYEYVLGVSEYTPEGEHVSAIRNVSELRRDYPGFMEDFQPECTSDQFLDRLLTLAQLSLADEVGCEPNPYRLI